MSPLDFIWLVQRRLSRAARLLSRTHPRLLNWLGLHEDEASRTAHDTVLLCADDVFTGAAAWSAAALVVVLLYSRG